MARTVDNNLARRDLFKLAGMGLLGASGSGWFPALAQELAANPERRRHAILLWMTGGPSQTDTFDMKPGHVNGGDFKEIATAVPGLRFSEHLPKLAEEANRLAIVRSLATREGDHSRGTHLVRTGHPPGTDVRYPSIACSLSKELQNAALDLPSYVSVGSQQFSPAAFGPGFLGPKYAPATVGTDAEDPAPDAADQFAELKLQNLELPAGVSAAQASRRFVLWQSMQRGFLRARHHAHFTAHHTLYNQAFAMMHGAARAAFDLESEPPKVREAYGRGRFGQGCLLARRLIERGVPFVEVALGSGIGWDTHQDNFNQVQRLSEELDAGWGTLMRELDERGLLDLTTILWMGEFGRTPQLNKMGGRDHFPTAWTCVFAGGGIQGGQAYGRTSKDGTAIEENQVEIGDVLATLCAAVGVSHHRENETPAGRPIKLAEGAPVQDILA